MLLMAVFSVFIQAACGACYSVVPFVSKRSTGLTSGIIAAAGAAGSGITQVRHRAGVGRCSRQAVKNTYVNNVLSYCKHMFLQTIYLLGKCYAYLTNAALHKHRSSKGIQRQILAAAW